MIKKVDSYAGIFVAILLLTGAGRGAYAQTTPAAGDDRGAAMTQKNTRENAAASGGTEAEATPPVELPDLKAINRPVLQDEKVNVNGARQPSFSLRENDGTEIREYRERGKPTEIEVRSSLGTYEVKSPNGGLKVDNPNERRLPSVKVLNF